jgi:hypothetical protein
MAPQQTPRFLSKAAANFEAAKTARAGKKKLVTKIITRLGWK